LSQKHPETQIKRLAVLGSTGSIGQQTLDVVRSMPEKYKVLALAAGQNLELLESQMLEFKPQFVYFNGSRSSLKGDCKFLSMEEMAQLPSVDVVIVATSGRAGLGPTLAAVRAGKKVALSNKESLVAAGSIITREARDNSAEIFPVDSEHSAVWQCLAHGEKDAAKIILTASGGPFRNYTLSQMREVTVEQALNHPSWRMGQKVTIDSATLMNKGLEVIEAHWLFDMPYDKIEVVVHPQSIVHSMVEFVDGTIKAQLSSPDMRLPIQYALSYPERFPNSSVSKLDWSKVGNLSFEKPDFARFPCLKMAIEAGRKGGSYPAALCAADEVAVSLFLAHKIKLTDIFSIVEDVLGKHCAILDPTLDEITEVDAWAREQVLDLFKGRNRT
jgi:1-deoxy-D-xylulose-5-phosphate reductoisomerase